MADILIRGMEMPTCCLKCPLNSDSVCLAIDGCTYDNTNGTSRRGDCPLVPLPEGQGRLGDLDALKADIDGFIECMTKVGAVVDGEMLWGKLLDALDNAKTIVPAEGGAENG